MSNFIILDNKIITSKYVLDVFDFIEKSNNTREEKGKVLFDEFQKVILQTKCTFGFTYTDNSENALRGRVGAFSGFRQGTQRLSLMPNNKWPKSRSKEPTCLRYYDFGRMAWRSLKKDRFAVATSFWNEEEQKWVDTPDKANISSNWNKIKNLNSLSKHKQSNRPDTIEEQTKREKVNKRELEKRNRQISKTQNKLKKSFTIEDGVIRL